MTTLTKKHEDNLPGVSRDVQSESFGKFVYEFLFAFCGYSYPMWSCLQVIAVYCDITSLILSLSEL
jgi:hypothetical protein